jgi:probable rRNA maturation factor
LTDDKRLHELNRDFLGIDAPTDVLSFPASESDPETGAPYLGDILLSIPRAKTQAKAAGHPLEAEVQLLVVHGVLHLLGHDHAKPGGKAKMWKAQADILAELGLSGITIQET